MKGFELTRFQNSVSLVGLHYNAQDDLLSQGQRQIVLQSDQDWGNSLLDIRCSEHAGPCVPSKFVEPLTVSPKPNMGREGFITTQQQLHLSRNLNWSITSEVCMWRVLHGPSRRRIYSATWRRAYDFPPLQDGRTQSRSALWGANYLASKVSKILTSLICGPARIREGVSPW